MSIEAIVLAGGQSRRFGSDKLAATLEGSTVLGAVIAAVSRVADRVVVAGPALPGGLRAGSTPVLHLPDREPFAGPLVALAAALESPGESPGESPRETPGAALVLVVGGDMPRVVPAVLAAMLAELDGSPATEAVLLGSARAGDAKRQVLPLALRRRPAARAAREALDAGQRSLQALVDRLAAVELPASAWLGLDPEGDSLIDVDTPADLERLRDRRSDADAPR